MPAADTADPAAPRAVPAAPAEPEAAAATAGEDAAPASGAPVGSGLLPGAGRRQLAIAIAASALTLVLSVLVGLVMFNTSRAHHDGAAQAAAPGPRIPDADGCRWWSAPQESRPEQRDVGAPPPSRVRRAGPRTMTIATDHGSIVIQMNASQTPCTVASFTHLAVRHFYDNTACHRLVTAGIFILQCGDPSGTGRGGPTYVFPNERPPSAPPNRAPDANGLVTYPRGTVGLANFGQDTNGSQFFIVYRDSRIPPTYPTFGVVTSGLDLLDQVAAGGDDGTFAPDPGGGHPKTPVVIRSVTVR